MGKHLKSYLSFLQEQIVLELQPEEKNKLKKNLLIKIGFFQHERLMHLIVTVTFALLTLLSFFCSFFYQNIGLYLLIVLFLVLLIPYLRHYYVLENGVQKLYQYYDKL